MCQELTYVEKAEQKTWLRHLEMESKSLKEKWNLKTFDVVYFDQCLGAANSKRWLKYALSNFAY